MLDVNILNDQDVGGGVWGSAPWGGASVLVCVCVCVGGGGGSEIEMSWSFQYLPPVAINT